MAQSICVFCSSSSNVAQQYLQAGRDLGRLMAQRGHRLVYGGGSFGLMGEVARAAQAEGGHVTGIIPEALLELELALDTVDEMIVTRDMHERKARMAARADAFISLPGGFGTFEELCEIIAHRQLGIHSKLCVVVNTGGYFDHIIAQFERAFTEHFAPEKYRNNYEVVSTPLEALELVERLA